MPQKQLRKTGPRTRVTPPLRQSPVHPRNVTRAEFNHIVALVHERGEIIDKLTKDLDIQITRMGQLQSQLDDVRQAWERSKRTSFSQSNGQG